MADTSKRGFASMDPAKQRQIASKGGRAAHEKGTAHEFSPDEARQAGRLGGKSVSRDRSHMARIGRRGGEAVSRDRAHMAQIGRRGGETVSRARPHTDLVRPDNAAEPGAPMAGLGAGPRA
mgnify:CR=1 FL=1